MRRGQIFSLDAMLSLVIIIMVVGTVSATSEDLKNEITSLVGWYERANIAENMLDVLTRSPGEPENWVNDPPSAVMVGIGSKLIPGTVNFSKLDALNSSLEEIASVLRRLAQGRDFMIEAYVSRYNVSVSGGGFPAVYLDNYEFNGSDFVFEKASGTDKNKVPIVDIFVKAAPSGQTYTTANICSYFATNQNMDLDPGSYLRVVVNTSTRIGNQNTKDLVVVPPTTTIEIYVNQSNGNTGGGASNLQLSVECENSVPVSAQIKGQGNVIVRVSGKTGTNLRVESKYVYPILLWEQRRPSYRFGVITLSNGTIQAQRDFSVLEASMNASPWIETGRRLVIVSRKVVDLSRPASATEPVLYGVLRYSLPKSAYFIVNADSVPQIDPTSEDIVVEYAHFVVVSDNYTAAVGIFYNAKEDKVGAAISNTSSSNFTVYWGNSTSVKVPLEALFPTAKKGSLIAMWKFWQNQTIQLQMSTVPDLDPFLLPKQEEMLIYLYVWDES